MAKLSAEQESKIDQVFEEFDTDASGDFDRDELIHMFRRIFHPDISIEEVDGVASAWLDDQQRDDNGSERINRVQFRAIMSHIIREHEQDWNLLCGLRHLMGKHDISNDDRLHASTMVEKSACDISLEEAEEMLWVADWRLNGHGDGRSLAFADVVAAVLLDISLPVQAKLPPRPKIPARNPRQSLPTAFPNIIMPFQAGQCACGNIFKEDSVFCRKCGAKRPEESRNDGEGEKDENDFAKLIVDLRDEAHDLRQLHSWAKAMTPPRPPSKTEDGRHLHKRIMDRHDGLIEKHDAKRSSVIDTVILTKDITCKLRLWCLLEEPHSSTGANFLSWFMGAMIMSSVVALVLEPLTDRSDKPQSERDVWKVLELYFTVIFSLELLVRFIVADAVREMETRRGDVEVQAPTRWGFVKGPSNICDFCAVLPYYVEVIYGSDDDEEFKLLRFARLMRLSRVMKLAKLSNRSAMFGPIAMVLTVIWGIYLKTIDD